MKLQRLQRERKASEVIVVFENNNIHLKQKEIPLQNSLLTLIHNKNAILHNSQIVYKHVRDKKRIFNYSSGSL